MNGFWNYVTTTFDEHSVVFVLLSALIVTTVGALAKLLFDTLLTGRISDLREAHRTVAKYRNPLLQAADSVRARIHNLTHAEAASFDSSDYYKLSTLYVFCSYFAWIELLLGRLMLLHFESTRRNRRLNRLILNVEKAFNNREYFLTDLEYRDIPADTEVPKFICKAIGELSCKRHEGSPITSVDFVEFVRLYRNNKEFKEWVGNLERFLRSVQRRDGNLAWDRLNIIEIALTGLINYLDPGHEMTTPLSARHTRKMMSKIFLPGAREVLADDIVTKRVPVCVEPLVSKARRRLRLEWEAFARSWFGEMSGLAERLRARSRLRVTAARAAHRQHAASQAA